MQYMVYMLTHGLRLAYVLLIVIGGVAKYFEQPGCMIVNVLVFAPHINVQ